SVKAWPRPSHISSDIALRFSGLLKVTMPTPSLMALRILPSAKDFSDLVTSSIARQLSLGVGRGERADIGAGKGRPRLYPSPPFGDARMVLFGYLIRRNLLVDALDEGNGGDIGDRIGFSDQPAGRAERRFHLAEQLHELRPCRITLFFGVGLARHAEPGL